MIKKIVVGETELIIDNLYPYRYDYGKGKQVLRIDILKTNHTFDEIENVLNNTSNLDIVYYEDDEKINAYTNYCIDFNSMYADGKFSIEITRLSQLEIEVNSLKTKMSTNQLAIAELSDIVLS